MNILFLDDITHYRSMPDMLIELLRNKDGLTLLPPESFTPAHDPAVVAMVTAGTATPEVLDRISEHGFYHASETARQVVAAAQPGCYDLVVIGNNLGEGLVLAELLDPALRPTTIIVGYELLPPEKWQPYMDLGYNQHLCRQDLCPTIRIKALF